jgi:hypothetical protein
MVFENTLQKYLIHDLFIVTVATFDAWQNHWIGYNSEGRKPRWFSPVASGVRGQDFSKGLLPINNGWQWISDGRSSHYTLVQVSTNEHTFEQ